MADSFYCLNLLKGNSLRKGATKVILFVLYYVPEAAAGKRKTTSGGLPL